MKKIVLSFLILFISFPFLNVQASYYNRIAISWTTDKNSVPAILFEALTAYAKENKKQFPKYSKVSDHKVYIPGKDGSHDLYCRKNRSKNGLWEYSVDLHEWIDKEKKSKFPVVHLPENDELSSIAAIIHNALLAYAKKSKHKTLRIINKNSYTRIIVDDGNRLVSHKADKYELWAVKKKLDVVPIEWDMETFNPEQLRVGSPLYNFLRDLSRTKYPVDGGPGKDHGEDQLLEIEKWSNVGPNDILVVRRRGKLHVEGTGVKYYLIKEGTGLVELALESANHLLLMGVARGAIQPIAEIVLASISNEALVDRLHNDLLSVVDSTKGIGFSLYDIFDKLTEGDVVRSVKAMVRVPFNVADLGLTLANKIIGLPFALIKSAINATIDIFTEDEDHELVQRISNNNDYDVDLTVHSKGYRGSVKYERGSFWKHGERQNRATYTLMSTRNGSSAVGVLKKGDWKLIRIEKKRYLYSSFTFFGKELVLIGTVEGDFDIDIEGKIIRKKDYDALVKAKKLTIVNVRRKGIGFFHFND